MGMKVWAGGLALLLILAACGKSEPEEVEAEGPPAPAAAEAMTETADTVPAAEAPAPRLAAEGAPAFAVLYPGGAPSAPAEGDTLEPGTVVYVAAATPDQVLDFYQAEAEKAGLSPVMALRQGERGGFGALSATTGESLDVWAEQVEGATRVTLSWSTGRGA